MKALGLDPGYGRLGWAAVELKGSSLKALEYGVFETPASATLSARLAQVHGFVCELVARYPGAEAAVETLYFSKNVKTAFGVAQARGVILLAIENAGMGLLEVPPSHVKMAVAASGRADKAQVQAMVQRLLGLAAPPKPDDAADALALAMAALRSAPMRKLQAQASLAAQKEKGRQ